MKRASVCLIFFALLIAAAHSDFTDFTFLAPRFNFRFLEGPPVPVGADMEFRFPLAGGHPVAVSVRLGAG
ncbi:MAG TPA: hypothetical protein VLH39_04395, partial [Magnetospirillaceae bacterium]|nr:hypothetical protein [Magnetospirillaceae bacterium]